jgi:hypothetical protein
MKQRVNNAFIRKSTTNYTLNSVKGSPYTLSSDGRTVEDHASIELLQRDRESLEELVVADRDLN